MTREKRLGRGLEALLGRVNANAPAQSQPGRPETRAQAAGPYASADEPYGAFGTSYGDAQPEPAVEKPGPSGIDLTTGVPLSRPAPAPAAAAPTPPAEPHEPGPLQVPIRQIESNPYQPRTEFDEVELESLCESLQTHGLLQPVVVRKVGDRYQLIAGERRLRAASKAGWTEVPVQVIEADDRELAELAIVENLHRKDLNALEKAASFQRYLEQYGCTQEELASRLKLDRSTIANLIRLLELPDSVQQSLREGKITQGHARSLLPLGDEREQVEFCRRIQAEGLSVRQTETMVQEMITQADAEPLSVVDREGNTKTTRRITSEHVAGLEQEFRTALGVRVKLTHNARGKGKLVIPFSSHEEFERIREHICGPTKPETRSQAG